jgi:hypothetical protein
VWKWDWCSVNARRPTHCFFSPALKGRALLLSTYEKELLALVTSVQKWQPYLLGQSFIVHTDQQSLKFLLEQKVGTNSQHRWASKLLGYDFAFEYKKGKDNRVATERFRLKVTEVEESKYLDIVKVEELVGSLQTNELSLPQSKRKNMALKTVREEASDASDEDSSQDEELALFAKEFRKFLNIRKGNSRNKSSKFTDKSKSNSSGASQGKKEKNFQGIQCHECSSCGHIRAKSPNYKKS